jgi:hypothetical protein
MPDHQHPAAIRVATSLIILLASAAGLRYRRRVRDRDSFLRLASLASVWGQKDYAQPMTTRAKGGGKIPSTRAEPPRALSDTYFFVFVGVFFCFSNASHGV